MEVLYGIKKQSHSSRHVHGTPMAPPWHLRYGRSLFLEYLLFCRKRFSGAVDMLWTCSGCFSMPYGAVEDFDAAIPWRYRGDTVEGVASYGIPA